MRSAFRQLVAWVTLGPTKVPGLSGADVACLLHVARGPMGRTHRVLLTCVGYVSSCVDVGVLRWGAKASALCIAINASFSGPVGGLTKRYTTCSNILKERLQLTCQFHRLLSIAMCVYVCNESHQEFSWVRVRNNLDAQIARRES